jgi:hypothetical protein
MFVKPLSLLNIPHDHPMILQFFKCLVIQWAVPKCMGFSPHMEFLLTISLMVLQEHILHIGHQTPGGTLDINTQWVCHLILRVYHNLEFSLYKHLSNPPPLLVKHLRRQYLSSHHRSHRLSPPLHLSSNSLLNRVRQQGDQLRLKFHRRPNLKLLPHHRLNRFLHQLLRLLLRL